MKLDRIDFAFAGGSLAESTLARIITIYIVKHGGIEMNVTLRSYPALSFSEILVALLSIALFILIDPYRKLGLSAFFGVVSADFVHDTLVFFNISGYTNFAFGVFFALMPILITAFWLCWKNDPRKKELKTRRNWKVLNL